MIKFYIFISVFLLCLSCTAPIQGRSNLKNMNKALLLNAGPYKNMYVIFNHSSHKGIACRNCHHEGLPGDRYASCTNPECHAISATSSREPLSIYMAYHAPNMKRSCLGCHKPLAGKYPGFKGCGPCHKSLRAKAVEEKLKK